MALFDEWWPVLVLMLICCERKILLDDWLILADKFKRTAKNTEHLHRYRRQPKILPGLDHVKIHGAYGQWAVKMVVRYMHKAHPKQRLKFDDGLCEAVS
jgi:hypothetical protein